MVFRLLASHPLGLLLDIDEQSLAPLLRSVCRVSFSTFEAHHTEGSEGHDEEHGCEIEIDQGH
jgi:hypothetical protein